METFRVSLFASFADLFGQSQLEVLLPSGSTVRDLESAVQQLPRGESLPSRLTIAVNRSYASAETLLFPGDEIAVIPPVAGG